MHKKESGRSVRVTVSLMKEEKHNIHITQFHELGGLEISICRPKLTRLQVCPGVIYYSLNSKPGFGVLFFSQKLMFHMHAYIDEGGGINKHLHTWARERLNEFLFETE